MRLCHDSLTCVSVYLCLFSKFYCLFVPFKYANWTPYTCKATSLVKFRYVLVPEGTGWVLSYIRMKVHVYSSDKVMSNSHVSPLMWTKLISPLSRIYASVSLVGIGSNNGLSPIRCQAIILINAGSLSIGPLGTNFESKYETFHSRRCIQIYRLQNGDHFVGDFAVVQTEELSEKLEVSSQKCRCRN